LQEAPLSKLFINIMDTINTQNRNQQIYSGKVDLDAWFKIVNIDYECLLDEFDWDNLFGQNVTLLDIFQNYWCLI